MENTQQKKRRASQGNAVSASRKGGPGFQRKPCGLGAACRHPTDQLMGGGEKVCNKCKIPLHPRCGIHPSGDQFDELMYCPPCHATIDTSDDASDDAGDGAAGTVAVQQSAGKGAAKSKKPSKDIQVWDNIRNNYKSRDDVEITGAEANEKVQHSKRGSEVSRLKAIAGVSIVEITNKVLINFMVANKIGGYKKKNRSGLCELIVAWKLNNNLYDKQDAGKANKKTKKPIVEGTPEQIEASIFRFVNILIVFDDMRSDFAKIKQQPSKATLTKGKQADQEFFEDMAKIYGNNDDGSSIASEDDLLLDFHYKHEDFRAVDLDGYIPDLSWEQLRYLYKLLLGDFSWSYRRWKLSGTHQDFDEIYGDDEEPSEDRPFTDFYQNNKKNPKTLYWFMFLQEYPDINQVVVGELPEEARRDTGARKKPASEIQKERVTAANKGKIEIGKAVGVLASTSKERLDLSKKIVGIQTIQSLQDQLFQLNDEIDKLKEKRRSKKKYLKKKDRNKNSQDTEDTTQSEIDEVRDEVAALEKKIEKYQQRAIALEKKLEEAEKESTRVAAKTPTSNTRTDDETDSNDSNDDE